jgi:hypothetical protein
MPDPTLEEGHHCAAPLGSPPPAELRGFAVRRRFTPAGLHVEGRIYASPELQECGRRGVSVQVEIDPRNVSRVRVHLSERGEWVVVPLLRRVPSILGDNDGPADVAPPVATSGRAWGSRSDPAAMSIAASVIAHACPSATASALFDEFTRRCRHAGARRFSTSTFRRLIGFRKSFRPRHRKA